MFYKYNKIKFYEFKKKERDFFEEELYLELLLECIESMQKWIKNNEKFLIKLEWFRDNNVGEEIEKQTEKAIIDGTYKIISEAIIPERYKNIFCGNRKGYILCSNTIKLKNGEKFEVNFILDPNKLNEPRQLYEWESIGNEWNELLVWPISDSLLPAETVYQSYIELSKNKKLLKTYNEVLKIKQRIDKKEFNDIIKWCLAVEHKIKENILLKKKLENKNFDYELFMSLKKISKKYIDMNIIIEL